MAQEMGFFLSHARVSAKRHKGIKGDDIFNLFQQLSTMIQAGMPLMDALQLTAAEPGALSRDDLGGIADQQPVRPHDFIIVGSQKNCFRPAAPTSRPRRRARRAVLPTGRRTAHPLHRAAR